MLSLMVAEPAELALEPVPVLGQVRAQGREPEQALVRVRELEQEQVPERVLEQGLEPERGRAQVREQEPLSLWWFLPVLGQGRGSVPELLFYPFLPQVLEQLLL